jgi:serine/threonine-protein kinase RsbW
LKLKRLEFDTASEMSIVDTIQEVAEIEGVTEGLDPDSAHFFSLALREAVVNAIHHGNKDDPGRRVQIGFLRTAEPRLVFTVKDEGAGFEPSRVPDPRAPENLTRAGGRGVFYMREFADRVAFSFPKEGGTLVRLEKRLRAPGKRAEELDSGQDDGR